MKSKKLLFAVVVLGLLAGGGWWAMRGDDGGGPRDRYQFQPAEMRDLTQSVSANGTLNPVTMVSVGTQVSGTVRRLYVDFNARVSKGQLLLELDDAILSAQVRQSEANVKSATADLELAQANETRMRTLFEQEYVSRQELDQALQARKSAQAKLELTQAQLERDRANLAYTVIRSPVSGVVVDRVVDVGQTVAASFQTPTLIKIAQDLAKMQIDSSFAEADIGKVRVGQMARFNVDAFPNRSFEGRVRQIRLNPTTQQNVVTYDVVIGVDNPDQTLLPGMTAYVNIGVAKREQVLVVPNAALRFKPQEETAKEPGPGGRHKRDSSSGTVWRLEGGRLQAVSVTLGVTDGKGTEVVAGELKPGDQVAVGEVLPPASQGKPSGVQVRMF